jgi:curli biogenesis system outer membrane secretion channel CsgG
MKQANLVFILALAAAVVIFKVATRNTAAEKQSATGGTPVTPHDPSENVAITEAAYHQDASDFAPAFGDENSGGEEVTSLQ